jgi:hypothetical protein
MLRCGQQPFGMGSDGERKIVSEFDPGEQFAVYDGGSLYCEPSTVRGRGEECEPAVRSTAWCVRRQAQFLGQKEAQDQETIWTQFHQRMKNRPHFTVRDRYSSQNVSKAEAEALFSLWERNGWILRIESKEPHGRGRPPSLHRYRFARILAKL